MVYLHKTFLSLSYARIWNILLLLLLQITVYYCNCKSSKSKMFQILNSLLFHWRLRRTSSNARCAARNSTVAATPSSTCAPTAWASNPWLNAPVPTAPRSFPLWKGVGVTRHSALRKKARAATPVSWILRTPRHLKARKHLNFCSVGFSCIIQSQAFNNPTESVSFEGF